MKVYYIRCNTMVFGTQDSYVGSTSNNWTSYYHNKKDAKVYKTLNGANKAVQSLGSETHYIETGYILPKDTSFNFNEYERQLMKAVRLAKTYNRNPDTIMTELINSITDRIQTDCRSEIANDIIEYAKFKIQAYIK